MESPSSRFVTNRFGDRYLACVNGAAFNAVGASLTFQRHFKDALAKEETLCILVGSDSGLLAQHLLAEGIPRGTRYLFVEPDALEADLLAHGFPTDDALRLSSASAWQAAATDWDISLYFYLDKVSVVRSLGALDAHLPAYRDLARRVEAEVAAWTWRTRTQLGAAVFTRMQMRNAADNRMPAAPLKDLFAGKTGVLLAGGPSLDGLLPWVAEHRERLVVMAVSRVARRLQEAHCTPDIVVSVDPHDVSFDVSKEALLFPDSVVLVHAYHVVPALLAQWAGPTVYLGNRLPWDSPLNVTNLAGVGPTVSNTAVELAQHLGLGQLVLAGMDLCHSPEGYTHAKGSNEYRLGPRFDDTGLEVETFDGRQARTTADFLQALRVLETQAQRLSDRLRIINPASTAARCAAVQHCAVDAIPLPALSEPAATTLARLCARPDDERVSKDLKTLRKELLKARTRLGEIAELCAEGMQCNAAFFAAGAAQKDFRFKQRMDAIESRLDTRYPTYATLLKQFGMPRFMALSRTLDMAHWSEQELERYGQGYYEAYQSSATGFIELVDDAIRRTDARLEERKPAPRLNRLLEQWLADRQPGRLLRWQQRRNTADAPPREAGLHRIDTLRQQWQALFDAPTDGHLARTEIQRLQWLTAAPSRMRTHFEAGETDALRQMTEAVASLDLPSAAPVARFGHALLAELEGRDADAIDGYGQLIQQDTLTDPALARALDVSLRHEDYAAALDIMAALAARSTEHVPSYARLLGLLGHNDEAIAVCERYLADTPDDDAVRLRLAQLRLAIGDIAGAESNALRLVETQPGNAAAREILAEIHGAKGAVPEPAHAD